MPSLTLAANNGRNPCQFACFPLSRYPRPLAIASSRCLMRSRIAFFFESMNVTQPLGIQSLVQMHSVMSLRRTLNYTRRVILAKRAKKHGRCGGFFQYHTARSISDIGRAADITVSTCPKGVNLSNLVVGLRGSCRARLRMAHSFNRVGNAPRVGILQRDAVRAARRARG